MGSRDDRSRTTSAELSERAPARSHRSVGSSLQERSALSAMSGDANRLTCIQCQVRNVYLFRPAALRAGPIGCMANYGFVRMGFCAVRWASDVRFGVGSGTERHVRSTHPGARLDRSRRLRSPRFRGGMGGIAGCRGSRSRKRRLDAVPLPTPFTLSCAMVGGSSSCGFASMKPWIRSPKLSAAIWTNGS